MMTSLLSWGLGLIFAGILVREDRAKRARNRLSRDWRRRVFGQWQRVGVGDFFIRGAGDGYAGIDSRSAAQDQRGDSAEPDDLHLAERDDRGDPDYFIRDRRLIFQRLSARRRTPNRLASMDGAGSEETGEARHSRGMAGICAGAFDPVGILGLAYIAQVLAAKGPMAALDLNTYNLLFLMMGLLLHWRPRSFVRAVNDSVPRPPAC